MADDRVELLLLDEDLAERLVGLEEPKSTPSGTMTAARPPVCRSRRKRARKSSSVFLVLTICWRSLAVDS
jgi:hypothetical protein